MDQILKGNIENSMFIKKFKCLKCNNESLELNHEKTIESYIENDFNIESLILTLEGKPPHRPGYLIFKCPVPNCGNIVRYTEEEILKNLIDEWTEMAWKMAKQYALHYYKFEDQKTRFLYDDRIKKFIKGNNQESLDYLDTAELYRDFAKFLKDGRKKYTK